MNLNCCSIVQLLQDSAHVKGTDAFRKLGSLCREWASANSITFVDSLDKLLDCSDTHSFQEMTELLMGKDPFDWAEKLVGNDQAKALELYLKLHPVISEWLLLPC